VRGYIKLVEHLQSLEGQPWRLERARSCSRASRRLHLYLVGCRTRSATMWRA
jgi:hypothetical protein